MPKNIYHNHHIIPRHAGGTDHPDNLVQLTIPKHAEAHRKLYEEYGRWQDKLAYRSLSGLIGKEEIIRQKNIQQRLGKKASEETKRKMSETRLGKPLWPNGRPPFSAETRAKMSDAHKDKIVSAETRAKMSKTKSGENNPFFGKKHSKEVRKNMRGTRGPQKKTTCPHCSKLGGISPMKRWHFSNCREIA